MIVEFDFILTAQCYSTSDLKVKTGKSCKKEFESLRLRLVTLLCTVSTFSRLPSNFDKTEKKCQRQYSGHMLFIDVFCALWIQRGEEGDLVSETILNHENMALVREEKFSPLGSTSVISKP